MHPPRRRVEGLEPSSNLPLEVSWRLSAPSCGLLTGENVTETWDMLKAGKDCVTELPDDRVNKADYW